MNISELSEKTQVSQRMLRHFEKLGLLQPARDPNNYRKYSKSDTNRVLKVLEWQRMGVSLREIGELLAQPENAGSVLEAVFIREREAFLLKQKALEDLRAHLTGRKHPVFDDRVAYRVFGLEDVLEPLQGLGWKCKDVSYLCFSDWLEETSHSQTMIGEMAYQSAVYVVHSSQDEASAPNLYGLSQIFFKAANQQWPVIDGHPPRRVDHEDLCHYFAPGEVVVSLEFHLDSMNAGLLLPYQVLFAISGGREAR